MAWLGGRRFTAGFVALLALGIIASYSNSLDIGFYFDDLPNRAAQLADDRIRVNNSRYRRSFPQTIDGMRQPPYHNLDVGLAKTFSLGRGMRLQVRAEAINAENYSELSGLNTDPTSGSFGFFNSQRTLPRDIQLGARLTF